MNTKRRRPTIRIRAHNEGANPFAEAYADVFALLLRKAKSSIRTLDCNEPFHYDKRIVQEKERDHNGTAN